MSFDRDSKNAFKDLLAEIREMRDSGDWHCTKCDEELFQKDKKSRGYILGHDVYGVIYLKLPNKEG